jgi:DNA-binding FadR family transcriptional regulator
MMIEPKAADYAAQRASAREIAEIAEAFSEMSESSIKGVSGVDADLRFHRAILAASKNALLLQVGNLIAVGLYISHQISSESFTVFLPLHKKVLDAIMARDGVKARAAMEQLLSESLEFMSRHLSKKQPRVARTRNLSTA